MPAGLPPLYVSYGTAKSGSTFAFELTKGLLLQHGLEQPHLSPRAVREADHINFTTSWQAPNVAAMIDEARGHATTIVVKTHQKPSAALVQRMLAGEVVGHAVYRDPRDMALSMLDAGANARANGLQAFAEITSLDDVLPKIDFQIEKLELWAALPAIELIDYGTLTTRPDRLAKLLTRQTGLTFDVDSAVDDVVEHRFIQFNKGRQHRHRDEMTDEDAERFRCRYASFYERFLPTMVGG